MIHRIRSDRKTYVFLIRMISSSCPKGSGCCPTSRADAGQGDESGTTVAFNPGEGTGESENESENFGQGGFGEEEISQGPTEEEEISEVPSEEEEVGELASGETGEFGEEFDA